MTAWMLACVLSQEAFPWKTDLEGAMAEGRASGKPVLIVFR